MKYIRLTRDNLASFAPALSHLEMRCRTRRVDPAYWQWCYFDNPFGDAIPIMALANGEVVGKFGLVPLSLQMEQDSGLGYLMEGLLLLPEYRKWHYLTGLMKALFSETKDMSSFIGFGFATALPAKWHHQLGMQAAGRLPVWSLGLHLPLLLADRGVPGWLAWGGHLLQPFFHWPAAKPKPAGDFRVAALDHFPEPLDWLTAPENSIELTAVRKTPAYLNWRYGAVPGRVYYKLGLWQQDVLQGMAVYVLAPQRRDAFLVELAINPQAQQLLPALCHSLLMELRAKGVAMVAASFGLETHAAKALRQLGFKSWATNLWRLELVLMGQWPDPSTSPRSWAMTLGDLFYH